MTELSAISSEDFLRFMDSLAVDLTCPHCRRKQFELRLAGPSVNRTLAIIDVDIDKPSLTDIGRTDLLSLLCKTCGYTRLFDRDLVTKWLEANPE